MKGANPATHIFVRGGSGRKAANEETACVVGGRVGRIWEGLPPEFDVGFLGVELDMSEQVSSRPRDPRFGDDATCLERGRFVA